MTGNFGLSRPCSGYVARKSVEFGLKLSSHEDGKVKHADEALLDSVSVTNQGRRTDMNRIKAYGMILLGVPAGYIASYFMQASALRIFMSLGQYIMSAHKILLPNKFGQIMRDGEAVQGAYVTAFVGIAIGVIAFGAIAYRSEAKSKKQD